MTGLKSIHKRWGTRRLALITLLVGLLVAGLLIMAMPTWAGGDQPDTRYVNPRDKLIKNFTVDHSKFDVLKKDFKTAPEVTKACLSCHTEAGNQLMHVIHWTWEFKNPKTGQLLGKKHVLNNFCIAVTSNWPRCTSCHAGYGWKDANFDFSKMENMDCLVCHDTTGKYRKFPAGAGHPAYEPKEFPPGSGKIWQPPDLSYIAQHVGMTSRQTCGRCHFYGGGGDGVKHGDLDSSLFNPPRELDVHMSPEGLNFQCSTCHTNHAHKLEGSRYAPTAVDPYGQDMPVMQHQRATCESCHGTAPHKGSTIASKLNDHVDKVACQTCHIPAFARGGKPTKMWWDWSKAGKFTPDGKKIATEEYNTLKGEFRWEENVIPEYAWFNGTVRYTLATDKIDPSKVVPINRIEGSYDDGRIFPFKVMRGKQPYDAGYNTLVIPHLFGKDDTAYWKNFDWGKAIAAGMKTAGLPYSGKYGFVETKMYWPIDHMVAPKEQALKCQECHSKDGRLAKLKGFYLPGRDRWKVIDVLGWLGVALTLVGVLAHGGLRIISAGKKGAKR